MPEELDRHLTETAISNAYQVFLDQSDTEGLPTMTRAEFGEAYYADPDRPAVGVGAVWDAWIAEVLAKLREEARNQRS